jgi:hypothetical protein
MEYGFSPTEAVPMPDSDEFLRRANEVREIAAGIFDEGERETVLRFVDDCEKRGGHPPGRKPAGVTQGQAKGRTA